jgi:hypothetical protein
MTDPKTVVLLVLSVTTSGTGCLIRAQDLRTGEQREFNSWADFRRYAKKEARRTKLR